MTLGEEQQFTFIFPEITMMLFLQQRGQLCRGGSICGPLLFICFTSDVTCTVRTNCIMYADDIKLYHRVKCSDDADALQADLDRLAEWSRVWRLKLNPSKCNVISLLPYADHIS